MQNNHAAGNDLLPPWRQRFLVLNPAACVAAINDLQLK